MSETSADEKLHREAEDIGTAVKSELSRPTGQRVVLDISYAAIFKVVGVLIALYLLGLVLTVIIWIVVALLAAAALVPYEAFLERRGHIPRALAVIIVALSIAVACALVIWLVVPNFVTQARYLVDHSDQYLGRLQSMLARHGIQVQLGQYAGMLSQNLGGRLDQILVPAIQDVFDAGVAIFAIVFITVYLLTDRERLTAFFVGLVPARRRRDALDTLGQMRHQVSGYVLGQAIRSATVGAFTFVLLLILGIPSAFPLAVFAGLADIIPLFGAWIAGIPPVVVALAVSPAKALIIVVAFVVYLFFEDHVLIPNVHSRTNRVSPLVALVAVIAGGYLLGFVGILIALPVAASVPALVGFFGVHLDLDNVRHSAEALKEEERQ
ncbi:MAG TPA: AI-2E family transporter [Thermomicrobiales bacterium]|nr:AI-2E family transporter [Thermomicrobiales bacterium]